ALDIAIGWEPDVLVSDIAMPGEDGYALLRKLRARGGALGRVPAIALTALGGPADRVRSGAAGYQMHVTKPFDADELAAAGERAAACGGGGPGPGAAPPRDTGGGGRALVWAAAAWPPPPCPSSTPA